MKEKRTSYLEGAIPGFTKQANRHTRGIQDKIPRVCNVDIFECLLHLYEIYLILSTYAQQVMSVSDAARCPDSCRILGFVCPLLFHEGFPSPFQGEWNNKSMASADIPSSPSLVLLVASVLSPFARHTDLWEWHREIMTVLFLLICSLVRLEVWDMLFK